jgi:hypothetical protein
MSIVRSDRRPDAISTITEAQESARKALILADEQQAALDDLEVILGLSTEGNIAARDRLCVMHFPAGDKEGHTLDVCVDLGCALTDNEHDRALEDIGADDGGGEAENQG